MKIILFVFTGGMGFLTEIAIIQIAVSLFAASSIAARLISFPLAVFVTWFINRKITFTSKNKAIEELRRYVFVQVIGGLINLCIYYLIITNKNFEAINPILALAFASLCSMVFTYIGSRKIVFTNRSADRVNLPDNLNYDARNKLSVMQHTTNYNSHLQNLIKPYLNNRSKVLDFGAGLGVFAKNASAYCESILCVEPDFNLSQILKEKGFTTEPNIQRVEKQSIDFIYSFNALEHFDDDQATINELVERLTLNGIIFIYVPAANFLFSQIGRGFGHHRSYNIQTLTKLFEGKSLLLLKSSYVDSVGVCATFLYKILGYNINYINPRILKIYDRYFFPLNNLFDLLLNRLIGKNVYIVAQKVD